MNMNIDYDYWFFEIWEPEHDGEEPSMDDYMDWLDSVKDNLLDRYKSYHGLD